jgi:phosphoenolpyruvate-protein kinase (PTS system EI component)
VSVCGELAGDPAAAVVMIGLGLHKLSMSEANLARVKAALADITMDKARALGATCKNLATETEVKAYLQENLF